MLLGCIADDFTGASGLANTLNKGGMATVQFVGIPKRPSSPDCEAGVVALKTRSIAVAEAVAQSLAALAWLKEQGCRQYLFKYCSTFDSTPQGNIGPVAESLLAKLDAGIARSNVAQQSHRLRITSLTEGKQDLTPNRQTVRTVFVNVFQQSDAVRHSRLSDPKERAVA